LYISAYKKKHATFLDIVRYIRYRVKQGAIKAEGKMTNPQPIREVKILDTTYLITDYDSDNLFDATKDKVRIKSEQGEQIDVDPKEFLEMVGLNGSVPYYLDNFYSYLDSFNKVLVGLESKASFYVITDNYKPIYRLCSNKLAKPCLFNTSTDLIRNYYKRTGRIDKPDTIGRKNLNKAKRIIKAFLALDDNEKMLFVGRFSRQLIHNNDHLKNVPPGIALSLHNKKYVPIYVSIANLLLDKDSEDLKAINELHKKFEAEWKRIERLIEHRSSDLRNFIYNTSNNYHLSSRRNDSTREKLINNKAGAYESWYSGKSKMEENAKAFYKQGLRILVDIKRNPIIILLNRDKNIDNVIQLGKHLNNPIFRGKWTIKCDTEGLFDKCPWFNSSFEFGPITEGDVGL